MELKDILKYLKDGKNCLESKHLELFYKINKDTIYYGCVYPNKDGSGNTLTLWVPKDRSDLWFLSKYNTLSSYIVNTEEGTRYSRLRTLTGSVKKFWDLVTSEFCNYNLNGFVIHFLQDGVGYSERFIERLEDLHIGCILVAPYTKRY